MIISEVEDIKRFVKEDYECKFADAALRMGNCFRDEIGAQKDLETAYYYYLQADFAIRKTYGRKKGGVLGKKSVESGKEAHKKLL